MAVEAFVQNAYSSIVSWTYVLITILLVVKIIQFFTGGSLFGTGKDGGGGGGGGGGDGGGTGKDKEKERTARDKFEEGIKNPAYLKVWVTNEDDKNVSGVEITVFAKGFKGEHKYGPFKTGPDGLYPEKDFLRVPSGVPITVKWNYWLPKEEKYKSQKRSRLFLGTTKKRRFWDHTDITLGPGEEKTFEIRLPFQSEYPEGFEPFIRDVDTESEPGKIHTKAVVKSTTGL
jgi:hypothetical protein